MDVKQSYLFVTWEGGGNVPPVLGLARNLIKRGHRVRVLAEPCIEEAVCSTGAQFIEFENYFTRTDSSIDLIRDWKARPLSVPAVQNILVRPAFDVAKETLALLRDEPTDVLVADFMMIGALFAAELYGVKRVALFHMPEYLSGPGRPPGGLGLLPWDSAIGRARDRLLGGIFNRVLNQYLPEANKAREQLGLHALTNLVDVFHQADLRLIQTSEAFDAPIRPAPKNVRYVGPVLDDPNWVESSQELWDEDDQKPLVVVSLSTTYQNQVSALKQIIKALSKVDVRVLVTLGPAMAKEKFECGDNTRIVHSIPHSQVFPSAEMVITHAGHGTVMRALSNGLPLVCLPMGRDQLDNATLLEHHGAGIKLKPESKHTKIRRAVLRVLNDPSFKASAEKLKKEVLKEAHQSLAENYLEDLALA